MLQWNSTSVGPRGRRLGARLGVAALLLLVPVTAAAQPAATDAPAAPAPPRVDENLLPAAETPPAGDDVKKQLEELQKSVDDLQAKADSASTESSWADKLRLYGFTDVGVNRLWVDPSSRSSYFLNSANATSFVIGNLNVYIDAQPVKGWRSLVEIRFTNAPQGEIQSIGGLAGTFKRTQTQQTDPNASSAIMQMWGGYTVIERAHLDWTDIPWFKVRVGNFFTPFGIWNVDHGSPTLISVQMPEYIQLRQMPLRQTGIQVYGNTFKGEWELGYAATVTNGRQELSNFAFDDNRGFGGRLYANNEKGDLAMKFGASFYTGRVHDQEVDLASINPITFVRKINFDYREIVGGLDASLDVGRTRLRLEGVMSHTRYEDGKHEVVDGAVDGSYRPNNITTSGYGILAHQLPWVPIEPYLMLGFIHTPALGISGDTILDGSIGLNVRFNRSVLWKSQLSRVVTADLRGNTAEARDNSSMIFSRLVLVF